jgi:hypothetical protein
MVPCDVISANFRWRVQLNFLTLAGLAVDDGDCLPRRLRRRRGLRDRLRLHCARPVVVAGDALEHGRCAVRSLRHFGVDRRDGHRLTAEWIIDEDGPQHECAKEKRKSRAEHLRHRDRDLYPTLFLTLAERRVEVVRARHAPFANRSRIMRTSLSRQPHPRP